MMLSAGALSFLFLAVALGSQLQVIRENGMTMQHLDDSRVVFHSASDCCYSYFTGKLRCGHMKDYFVTSAGCSQPGAIFINKKGKRLCVDPREEKILNCMMSLKSRNPRSRTRGK